MNKWLWIIVIISSIVSLISSVVVVIYVFKKKQKREAEQGISGLKASDSQDAAAVSRKWNLLISFIYYYAWLSWQSSYIRACREWRNGRLMLWR